MKFAENEQWPDVSSRYPLKEQYKLATAEWS